jgi:membrane protein DedA with SNARE-associated domain
MSPEAFYWSASIFLWLFFTGLGIPPVPEEAGILYAAGLTSLHPEVPWWLAWAAASGGIIGADIVLYWVGRWMGQRLFQYRWVNRLLPVERRQRLEDRFHQHGMKLLLLARLLPPLRSGVFLVAGSIRYPFGRFLLAESVYGLFGVGLVFFGGTALLALIHTVGGWVLLLAALPVGGYLLYRYYRHLRKLELKVATKAIEIVEAAVPSPPPEQPPAQPVEKPLDQFSQSTRH